MVARRGEEDLSRLARFWETQGSCHSERSEESPFHDEVLRSAQDDSRLITSRNRARSFSPSAVLVVVSANAPFQRPIPTRHPTVLRGTLTRVPAASWQEALSRSVSVHSLSPPGPALSPLRSDVAFRFHCRLRFGPCNLAAVIQHVLLLFTNAPDGSLFSR